MKRIFIFTDNIFIFGGVERTVSVLSNELCKEYDVTIVSLYKMEEKPKFNIDERIKIITILENGEKIPFTKGLLKLRKKVKEKLKNEKPDVFIVASMRNFLLCTCMKKRCKKFIGWEHSSTFAENKPIKRGIKLGRIVAKYFADKIVVLTNRDLDNYIKTLHVSKEKMFQIYNAIDKKAISDIPYKRDSKKIITVGRICEDKGYDLLVQVAKIVLSKYPDWIWDIYGDTNYEKDKNELIKMVEDSGVKRQLILKGFSKNMYDTYKDYALYVMTSKNEGYPMCTLEAHGSKLPIVSFDCDCGPSEQIIDGVNGYLIPCFDINKMAERINYLIDNPEIRYEMSTKTMLDKEKVSIEFVINKWKELIEE